MKRRGGLLIVLFMVAGLAGPLIADEPVSPAQASKDYFNRQELAEADKAYTKTLKTFQGMLREMRAARNPQPFRQGVLTELLPAMEAAIAKARSIKPATGEVWRVHTPLLKSYEALDASLWQWSLALVANPDAGAKAAGRRGVELLHESTQTYQQTQKALPKTVATMQAKTTAAAPPKAEHIRSAAQGDDLKRLNVIRTEILGVARIMQGGNQAKAAAALGPRLETAGEALAILRRQQQMAVLPVGLRRNLLGAFEGYESALRLWQRGLVLRDRSYIDRGSKAFRAGTALYVDAQKQLRELQGQGQAVVADTNSQVPATDVPATVEIPEDPMHPLALTATASDLVALLRANPEMAASLYFSPVAKLAFADIRKLCGQGLKYFAHGVVPLMCYPNRDSALVGFYNPWIDAMLLTEWRRGDVGSRVVDVELISGDLLRGGGLPPFDVTPLWLRDPKAVPPVAVRAEAAATAKAFREVFGQAQPGGQWRRELQTLRLADVLTVDTAMVAGRLAGQMKQFASVIRSQLGKTLQADMKELYAGKASGVLTGAAGTDPETAKTLAGLPSRFWKQAQLMAVRDGNGGSMVFLNVPGEPRLFLSLLYLEDQGVLSLNRVDVFDLPVGQVTAEGGQP